MSRWVCFWPPAKLLHVPCDRRQAGPRELRAVVLLEADDAFAFGHEHPYRLQSAAESERRERGAQDHRRQLARDGQEVVHGVAHRHAPVRRGGEHAVSADLGRVAGERDRLVLPPGPRRRQEHRAAADVLARRPGEVGDLLFRQHGVEAVARGEQDRARAAGDGGVDESAQAVVVDGAVLAKRRVDGAQRAGEVMLEPRPVHGGRAYPMHGPRALTPPAGALSLPTC